MIDAHAHVFLAAIGDPERSIDDLAPADRSAPIDEFERVAGAVGVTAAVLVPLGVEDTYVAEVVARRRDRYRMVAVADPAEVDVGAVADRLDRVGADGLRWFGLPDLSAGSRWWKMLAMLEHSRTMLWLYLGADDVPVALDISRRFPGLQIVLNHSALPSGPMRVDEHSRPALSCDLDDRAAHVAPLCSQPNVWVIVSGQYAFATDDYPYPSVASYLDELGGRVGYERFVWGSDFPWITTAPGYTAELELPRRQLSRATAAELDAIFTTNPARLLGLSPKSSSGQG